MPTSIATRSIDYISFTIADDTRLSEVLSHLGLEVSSLGYGLYRYRDAFASACRGVHVLHSGCVEGMGVHVQISGRGCRLIEALPHFSGWIDWLKSWESFGAKFTRADLALDDRAGLIQFETVRSQVADRIAMRRSHNWRIQESHSRTGVTRTLYVGSRQSETLLRCYDKGAQLKEGSSWLRFEFEYKGERADAWVRLLIAKGWDAATGAVRSFIEFKDEAHQTLDKTRQRVASWWEELVSASKETLKGVAPAVRNISQVSAWFEKNLSSMFAIVVSSFGGDVEGIRDYAVHLAVSGERRFKQRHRMILAQSC